jgi:fructuronate reductase/mannitol 2-dehydrogenase
MKTRLLNAGHCAFGHLGFLAGHRRSDEAMADPVFEVFIRRLMDDEVTPLLPSVPGVDLSAYKQTLLERFANPKIGDELSRLCRSGSAKVPTHIVSSIIQARAAGRPHGLLTMAVAGWLRYLKGVDECGRIIEIDDPLAARLRPLAAAAIFDPRLILDERALFGGLGADEAFAVELQAALRAVQVDGARTALATVLAGTVGVPA